MRTILVDSREKTPWTFKRFKCKVRRAKLKVGDYSVYGYKDVIVVERKSFKDFLSSLKRGTLDRQIEKLAEVERVMILVEGEISGLRYHYFRERYGSMEFYLKAIADLTARFRVPIILMPTRTIAESVCFDFLVGAANDARTHIIPCYIRAERQAKPNQRKVITDL